MASALGRTCTCGILSLRGGGSILLTGVNSKVPSISYAENGALGCDVQ